MADLSDNETGRGACISGKAALQMIGHVVSDPDEHGGKPFIAGKGITVHYLARLYNLGWAVADLTREFDLTPGQVHAALSYYFDHQEAMDREIVESQAQTDELLQDLTRRGSAMSAADLRRRIEARKTG
jgi:uncharacterized protein (DUF433 family)